MRLLALALVLCFAGCKPSVGATGGTYCVAAGTWVEYGVVGGQIAFVICVNCSTSVGAVPDGISSGQSWIAGRDYWSGQFQKAGRDIGPFYQCAVGSDTIAICGSNYSLSQGAVFLVVPGSSATVKQIRVPVPARVSGVESQRDWICSQPEVMAFLGK